MANSWPDPHENTQILCFISAYKIYRFWKEKKVNDALIVPGICKGIGMYLRLKNLGSILSWWWLNSAAFLW